MRKSWNITDAISIQSQAHATLKTAISKNAQWHVGIPGQFPLYTAATKRAAEFMLSRNLARQGFVVYPHQ